MKHEWRKHEKDSYIPKEKPELITVPKHKFLMIDGQGNPNNEEFAEKVGALYSLAYGIRMMPKQGYTPEGYFEYTVYPLEGIWDLSEEGRKLDELNKDELIYTIMIRQPDFVDENIVKMALENVMKKKAHKYLKDVKFDTLEDGLCVQMLHIGPYSDEPETFSKMDEFTIANKLERASLVHREIYLSDVRRVEPAKLKTVLRYKVMKKGAQLNETLQFITS